MDLKTSRTHFDNIKNYFTQFLILFMFWFPTTKSVKRNIE
jgi:hypothetical protein